MLNGMKNKIKFLSVLLTCMFCGMHNGFAQEITAINFNGDLIGKVIPDGSVVSFDNEIIGNITADSLLVDANGALIGGIVPQGVVIGNDNKLMGRVNNDGSVRLPSGKIIGKVLPNGLVVNDAYEILGAVLFPGLVYNDQGETVGRLAGDGSYISLEGQNIGFISADGYAYRNNGIGYVLDGRLISAKMVVSSDGSFIGSVAPGGKVSDFEAKEIGRVHANGYVYNAEQKIIGKIVNGGYAFNNQGDYLGLISYNGEVLDHGKVIGYLRSDDKIINMEKEVIGYGLDIAATATDLNGKYLGRLIPNGKIVKAQEEVGTVGAKGVVLNADGVVIGQISKSGPVFDYLGNILAQALRNGTVTSLTGTPLGYMKGKTAYDNIGRILGAVSDAFLALDINNNVLGITGIGSELETGSGKYKISPFGYVFSADNILNGHALPLTPLYGEGGQIGGYLEPGGTVSGIPAEKQLKLTQFGLGVLPSDKTELFNISPLFAVNTDGAEMGILNQNNQIMNNQKKIIGRIVPEYKVIGATSTSPMPVTGAVGYAQIAVSINGNLLGYAGRDGVVKDYAGSTIGRSIDGQLVVNPKNSVIGRLISYNGAVNNNCEFLGVLDTRGKIRNGRDIVLGSVLTNGQVISDVGNVIGFAVDAGTVVNFEGQEIGTITATGTVLNYKNENIGCLRWDGRLYDGENGLSGQKVSPYPVMDFSGEIIGRLQNNGQFIDRQGNQTGYVQPDDTVVGSESGPIGTAFKYKFAFDNDNIFMGRVNDQAEVINHENTVLGKVNPDGAVVADGKVVGYALYDFYIYNENGQTIGYLLSDGTVANFSGGRLGKADKGFLVDRNYILVGRGNRDYVVRDAEHKAVGELNFQGDLLAYTGKVLGSVRQNGEIFDEKDNLVAKAGPLQYYNIVRPEAPKPADWAGKQIQIEPVVVPTDQSDEDNKGFSLKAVGIALTPDGNYLGDILANNDVVDKLGNLIGTKMPDGLIIDDDGNLIGIEEVKNAPAGQMFVPAGTFGPGGAYGTGNVPTNLGPGGGFGPGERYDPRRSAALAAAQAARREAIAVGTIGSNIKKEDFDGRQDNWDGAQYKLSSWRVDMSEMILADKPIPAVLARTLMSGADGVPATAIVERNVYAEDGRNIVIPAGSRIIGDGSVPGGGGGESSVTRIQISWKRLIRPDGSAFEFSSARTGDAQGRAGALGYVDEQLLKKYAAPTMASLLSNTLAYFTATSETTESGGDSTVESSKQQAANDARQNFLDNMDWMFNDLVKRKSEIQAAVYVPAGTRLIIYPMEDLWIRTIERGQNYEAKENTGKPEVLIDPNKTNNGSQGGSGGSSSGSNNATPSGVVYEEDDMEDVKPATPLIASKPKKKSPAAAGTAIPPVTSTGATPPPPSMNVSSSTGDSTPQLF